MNHLRNHSWPLQSVFFLQLLLRTKHVFSQILRWLISKFRFSPTILKRANKKAPPPSFEFKLFIQLERDPHKLNRNEIVAISGEVCVSVQLPICIIVPQLRFLAECPKFPNYHNCAKILSYQQN